MGNEFRYVVAKYRLQDRVRLGYLTCNFPAVPAAMTRHVEKARHFDQHDKAQDWANRLNGGPHYWYAVEED